MFGPNVVPGYSHRDKDFGYLFNSTIELFKKKFNLNREIVLLVSGSGTLANEIVLYSSKTPFLLTTKGLFSKRLADTQYHHKQNSVDSIRTMAVHYETSQSKLNDCSGIDFVDCISSFPYYDPPECEVWTTVTSKQIGAITGLSIVVVKEQSSLSMFNEEEHSYLSLKKYYNKALTGYTPNTPSMHSISSLHNTLLSFDLKQFREMIDSRYHRVTSKLKDRGIPFTGQAPVITIPYHALTSDMIVKYNLYTNSGDIQLFLWSGLESQYNAFLGDL